MTVQQRRLLLCAQATGSLLFEGDSLTVGFGSSAGHDYPSQCMAQLSGVWTAYNEATNGDKISAILANAVANDDSRINRSAVRNICVIWAGTNDIANDGATAAGVYANLQSFCTGRRAAGFGKLIVLTMLRRGDLNAAKETARQTLNTSLRSGWSSFADALADVAADVRLGDENDTTYYNADKVHLTDAGYGYVAAIVAAAIQTV